MKAQSDENTDGVAMDGTEARKGRRYAVSSLPFLVAKNADITDTQRDMLLAMYGEVCTNWRSLVDVRFKLLGLVPFVSVAALLAALPNTGSEGVLRGPNGVLLGLVGVIATLGIVVYDWRNSELHDDLISRARRIEFELGVDTGAFRGRKKPRHELWNRIGINHGTAAFLIYMSALAGWSVIMYVSW